MRRASVSAIATTMGLQSSLGMPTVWPVLRLERMEEALQPALQSSLQGPSNEPLGWSCNTVAEQHGGSGAEYDHLQLQRKRFIRRNCKCCGKLYAQQTHRPFCRWARDMLGMLR